MIPVSKFKKGRLVMYRKNAWLKYKDKKPVMDFAEGYKDFITVAKNERLAVREAEKLLKANGFKNAEEVKSVKAGDRVYFINKKKCCRVHYRQRTN